MVEPTNPHRAQADENPYAVPGTTPDDLAKPKRRGRRGRRRQLSLSGRGLRFGGAIIDTLLFGGLYVGTMFAFGALEDINAAAPGWLGGVAIVLDVLYLGVSCYLAAVRSQSVGKLLLGMQVVVESGQRAGFWRIALLRNVLPMFIPCFSIIDPFFIFFGAKKQCLHDMLASTYVVDYRAGDRR